MAMVTDALLALGRCESQPKAVHGHLELVVVPDHTEHTVIHLCNDVQADSETDTHKSPEPSLSIALNTPWMFFMALPPSDRLFLIAARTTFPI